MVRKSRYYALSDAQVRSIRWYYDQGWTRKGGWLTTLSTMFGVKEGTIQSIGQRKVRYDVPEKKQRRLEAA